MPVDFEVVNVDSTMASEDDINNAIMAIRRNGVALKGKCLTCACVSECVLKHVPARPRKIYICTCKSENNRDEYN